MTVFAMLLGKRSATASLLSAAKLLCCSWTPHAISYTSLPKKSFIKVYIVNSHRNFYVSCHLRLNTLFSEDQQTKIKKFINQSDPAKKLGVPKLRCLNKVITSIPERGPLDNINDLLEKYSITAQAAINACNTILQTMEKNNSKGLITEKPRKVVTSRKLNNLRKSIKPQVSNPGEIQKFAAVTVTENYVSFTVLERNELQPLWNSQRLSCWNVCQYVNGISLPEFVNNLWQSFPSEKVYVTNIISSRVTNIQNQSQLYGVVVSLMCSKNNFNSELTSKVFHATGRAPAREFNFLIGNEVVSPINFVTNYLSGDEALMRDDHVFIRSLNEVHFDSNAREIYKDSNDEARESLCQSLLLAKAFVQLLKER